MPLNTRYYKLGKLETAIVRLKTFVAYGPNAGSMQSLFTPTELAVLLEAARFGAAKIYLEPEILDKIKVEAP